VLLAAPDAVVLEQRLHKRAQSAQLGDQLLGFCRDFVPVRSQDAGDDDVDGLQQHVVDAERAKVGAVKLQDDEGLR
jgi:hypothetical protein